MRILSPLKEIISLLIWETCFDTQIINGETYIDLHLGETQISNGETPTKPLLDHVTS